MKLSTFLEKNGLFIHFFDCINQKKETLSYGKNKLYTILPTSAMTERNKSVMLVIIKNIREIAGAPCALQSRIHAVKENPNAPAAQTSAAMQKDKRKTTSSPAYSAPIPKNKPAPHKHIHANANNENK